MDHYLPIITSAISLITAIVVAFIGIKNSRSLENSRVRSSYASYAIQKLMDEYMKFDPLINLNGAELDSYVRRIEAKYHESRALIIRVSPLIDFDALRQLKDIEDWQSGIIKNEHNAKMAGQKVPPTNPDEYAGKLNDYINISHKVIADQIERLRRQLGGSV